MIARLKNYILLALVFLPIAAFADIGDLMSFLTPSQGEFSIRMLSKLLGSIGNVLYGDGNQIIGVMMGVINSCAVILIGVAVCFTVWDGVISAASNGEMMQHKGRKTVFTILRIVIGFCLVAPGSTGYSLGQNGVVWVVVQGVGLADRVSDKLYNYIKDGGLVFVAKPSKPTDISPYMPTGATVMKSAICMYKLQDIMIKEQKTQEEAAKRAAESEMSATVIAAPAKKIVEVGYSVNSDNTISFGTRNPDYDPSDSTKGYMYSTECGKLVMSVSDSVLRGYRLDGNATQDQVNAEKNVIMGYIKSAVGETVQNVLPIAKEISTLDPESSDYNSTLANLNARAIGALAGSGITFATIMDPMRRKSLQYIEQDVTKLIDNIHSSGWMYTPLLVMAPLLTDWQIISVSEYNPTTEGPDSTAPVFSSIEKNDAADLFALVRVVDDQAYSYNASQMLNSLIGENPAWSSIDFAGIDPYQDKSYLDDIVDYVDIILGVPRTALGMIKMFLNIGFDIAIGVGDFMNIGIDGSFDIIKDIVGGDWGGVWDGIKDKFCFGIFRDCEKNGGGLSDMLGNMRGMVNGLIDSLIEGMNGVVDFARDNAAYAKKGGMNDTLLRRSTESMGPMGAYLAMTMSAMVGRGIEHMENGVKEKNAFTGAIQMGGGMMKSAMEATFQMAHVSFYTNMIAMLAGGATSFFFGEDAGKAISGVTQFVNKVVDALTVAYVGFALMFFTGGLLLYVVLPLTFVLNFAAASLRWLGLVFISILATPIFCFNLLRSDGEGMFGRGERFLIDLGRTTLIPAILTVGAVIFMLLFNIGFMLVTSTLNIFLKVILAIYSDPFLLPVLYGVMLLVIAMCLLYMANLLASLCTHEFIDGVGNALGEALTRGAHENPMHELKQGVHGGGHQVAGAMKSTVGKGGKQADGGG